MLYKIDHFLPPPIVEQAQNLLQQARFVDGKLSAGSVAEGVKNNQEMDATDNRYRQLNELVMGHLVRHPLYSAIVWPKKIGSPFYARYEVGMTYGDHVDDPVMGGQNGDYYRSDISMTIFLSNKDDYDGGELVIMDSYGERHVKLDAGSVVFYPSTSRHYVAPVTRGVRQVAVTWAQSSIRDPLQRDIIYELNEVREKLFEQNPNGELSNKVSSVFNNLVRRWIDV